MQISRKNLHLNLSAVIVITVAIIYGANPERILPLFFDFEVTNRELKNIFRAIMGLYIAFALYWVIGANHSTHWRGATISNILFMGGLFTGRFISFILDGYSPQYFIGMFLEFLMMAWGSWSLRTYNSE